MGNPCDYEAYRTPDQEKGFKRIKRLFPLLFSLGVIPLLLTTLTTCGGLTGGDPTPTPFDESASVPVTVVSTATPPQGSQGGLVAEETEEPTAEPTDAPLPTDEPAVESTAEITTSTNILISPESLMTVDVFDQNGNVYEGVATEDGEDWTFATPPELDPGTYTFTAEMYDENGELVKSFAPRDLDVVASVDETAEMTDTVDATAEVTDTVDATDEMTDTVDATDEMTDTVDATAEVTDTVDATNEMTDTVDATDEMTDTVDATDEMTDTVDATDEITDTVDATDEMTDTVDATDEMTDTVDTTDEITDTVDATGEMTETVTAPGELLDGEAPGVALLTGENAAGFSPGTVLTISEDGQELGNVTVGDNGSYEGVCNLAPGDHILTFTDADGTSEQLSIYVKSLADFSGFPDNAIAGIDYLGRPSTYGEVDENNVYTVKSGDMSGQIVARYNTTIDDMFVFNPHIRNLSAIYVGQQMLVPFDQQCGIVE